jgi:hypothetical protein
MSKAVSGALFALAAVAGGFAGWALFGAIAHPDEKAANTGTGATGVTGATGQTGLTTESTLSPPSVSTLSPPTSTAPPSRKSPHPQPKPHRTSRAIFTINGHTYVENEYADVQTGGYVKVLDYSGPSGCAGRFFYIGQTGAFRYTAHNALLQMGDILYTFGEPPLARSGKLIWSGNFTGGGKTDQLSIIVYCALPPKSIPALPANGR